MMKDKSLKQGTVKRPRLLVFALSTGIVFSGIGLSHPAQAWTPPCWATECPAAAPIAWSSYQTAIIAGLGVFVAGFNLLIDNTIIKLTQYANQGTNNYQNTTNARGVMDDSRVTREYTDAVGQQRVRMAAQVMPSRTACTAATRQRDGTYARYGDGGAVTGTNAAIRAAESDANDVWSNAPGTAGNRGQLAYTNVRYTDRISRYNNQDGTGLPTAPSIGKDRDILPFESIFKLDTLAAADDYTAAKDVMLNMAGDVVVDPVRGPQLTRTDGQALAMQRNSDQARLNLVASVLMATVERRRAAGGALSEQAQQTSTSYTTLAMKALAKAGSSQAKGQNLDGLAVMIGDASRQLFVMYTFMEQWAAIKAVSLAVEVKQNSAGQAGLATRALQQ